MAENAPLSDFVSVPETDRLAEPVDCEGAPRLPFIVVGIGASAGGLEAFNEFFKAVPADSGMAYVLVQHLPPDRESLVAEILARHARFPVVQVEDGMSVERDHVYVIRPGRTLTIHEGKLHLGEPVEKRGHQRPVDDFFRSLAEEQRQRAICIVLSGMGSNGTAGAQAIKAVGGVCIAQEPDSAKFPTMPRSVIDAGYADFVLRPPEMPALLQRYSRHPYVSGTAVPDENSDRDRQALTEVLAVLRARMRLDFTGYKKPTVIRRVQRRMSLHGEETMAGYSRVLRQTPAEVSALADDLMIHVTGFFRDAEVWETLRQKVIVPLVEKRPTDIPIRAWVTACSSGEEAYTLAMLLVEAAEAVRKRFEIKIFATDTAERSLSHARAGIYPGGIESEISPERLERFFERDDSVYRIKKELRELVVFAPQNLLQDPPFSRLDLCTCRNLLIYLQPEMQQRALELLHFGLCEGGTLMLGTSETISGSGGLFEIVDKKHRIYRRIGPTRYGTVEFPAGRNLGLPTAGEIDRAPAHSRASFAQLTHKILLERYAPPSLVVDRQLRIVFFQGDTERFLDQPRGEPTQEVLSLVREPIRGAVRIALQRAMTQNEAVTVRDGTIETPSGKCRIEVMAAPLEAEATPSHYLVSFEESPETPPRTVSAGEAESSETTRALKEQLRQVQEELQSAIEELQTSNEEMKASNEETTSINEELQSTNEELETSKEELQSLNEELTTVNSQLQTKMEELEGATNDLGSLLSSTNIGVIFLDTNFRIRRFTPAIRDLFDLIPSDIGRPLRDLARKFRDDNLLADAQRVLERLTPVEHEVTSESGHAYLRRTLPYRTADNRIDGIVLTFVDITARKNAENSLRESEERHRLIIEGVQAYAIFMLDPAGKIMTWNPAAERLLGFSSQEALGHSLALVMTAEDRAAGVPEHQIKQAETTGGAMEDHWHVRKDGSRFWGNGVLSALRTSAGDLRGFVKILRDNTERKEAVEALKQAKKTAEEANDAKDQFLANVSHELRTPLSAMLLWTRMLEEDNYTNVGQVREAVDVVRKCTVELQELIEDLVDVSRIVSGKLRLELKPMDLAATVRTALDRLRHQAAEKKQVLDEDIDPAAGIVQADPGRLQQVVSNLLNNAIKFTPAGGKIFFSLRRSGTEVEIRVVDSGQGISAEFLSQIFSRFRQAGDATTRSTSGLGLGLGIAKQLVELHGGTIRVESEGVGKGATFIVRLPLPLLDAKMVVPRASASPFSGIRLLKDCRILLVEDSANTRDALAGLLRKTGAEVAAFGAADEAITEYQRGRVHLILSDLGLPRIDGHEMIRKIRLWEKAQKIAPVPALALTAYADDRNRRKALESGFNKTLTKPVDPEHLVSMLAALKPGQ